ncbi:uncharacterized protein LOC125845930 [Solanum stenotomum]|uniref:uncharacterized protein LOC125845930 n=1 Tax=Solanum stenotomum TaxID=172797 RepID=UPI0020D18B81|nr:uncharacterized protein LOC125845930 [Solanum stenotomum]
MLAQEIIHQIKKPNIGSNVVIKLDMAKAYDRVSWPYICLVLRRMGFDKTFIDMVWRIMANNWYSSIVNGKMYGFYQFTRGLKQGDPLSPALFILRAEVLSRSLNRIHNNPNYHGFFMEMRGPQVNHLSFADDIIIFTSGRKKSLELIMHTLNTYEETSGQLVSKTKAILWSIRMHSTALGTGLRELLLSSKFRTLWQTSFGDGKMTGKKYHWYSWKNLSFPYEEGGIGMINLKDRSNPISKKWDTGDSPTWKLLMHNKVKIEEHIHWTINSGTCSFWWDNWLGVGPLAHFSNESNRFNNNTVTDFLIEGQWNLEMVIQQALIACCSSAWNELREKRNSFGNEPVACYCCDRPGWDTIDHIFNTGHFATHVWRYARKYGGKQSNISRVKYVVYKDNYKLMTTTFPYIRWPSNWAELIKQAGKCFHDTKVFIVYWQRPPEQWVKLNTDGSALSNPGRTGAGGIIREHNGEMILAFATPLGNGTNNQAEIGAAIFGMTWVLQLGYKSVVLEVDSQLLVDWIM